VMEFEHFIGYEWEEVYIPDCEDMCGICWYVEYCWIINKIYLKKVKADNPQLCFGGFAGGSGSETDANAASRYIPELKIKEAIFILRDKHEIPESVIFTIPAKTDMEMTTREFNAQVQNLLDSGDDITWMDIPKEREPRELVCKEIECIDRKGEERNPELNIFDSEILHSNSLYPNPIEDFLNIEFESLNATDLTYRIYDIAGRMVMSNKVIVENGINLVTIQLESLESGAYFLDIQESGKSILTHKLIKH